MAHLKWSQETVGALTRASVARANGFVYSITDVHGVGIPHNNERACLSIYNERDWGRLGALPEYAEIFDNPSDAVVCAEVDADDVEHDAFFARECIDPADIVLLRAAS